MSPTALILGASGRFGRNMAQALASAGWQVRRYDRAANNLIQAAQGADVIVNGWNPKYYHWAAQVPDLHKQAQEAARAANATILLPGNVYVFGAQTPPPWSAQSPHAATNPLGRIRTEMEDSYRRSGVQTILIRAGDFLDTEASGNWFDQIMAPKVAKGRFTYPGNPDIPHAWAFLPDLARAFVGLANRRHDLPQFTDLPFPGYTLTGREMAGLIAKSLGQPVQLKPMAWAPMRLAQPFVPMIKHLFEMRYLWNTPHWLEGDDFARLCPDLVQTPVEQAIAAAIRPFVPAAGGAALTA